MTGVQQTADSGKALTIKKSFSRTTTIFETINAPLNVIWTLLTNASDYSRWNTTIISITGRIKEGEKIQLTSTLDPSRTFKLKIKELIVNEKMVWGDAMGERVYTLKKEGGKVLFTMHEKIGGLMFPLFANKIPSFDQSFEEFTANLKTAAESKISDHEL